MNPIARHAEVALHATSHPALRLHELLEQVSRRVGRSLTPETLRAVLEDRPDRFRILESWTGPWRVREGTRREGTGPEGTRPEGPDASDAWVVAVGDPETPPDAPATVLRLRESVRWVALGMDGRSRIDASRWYAIALAEREARRAVARRAA